MATVNNTLITDPRVKYAGVIGSSLNSDPRWQWDWGGHWETDTARATLKKAREFMNSPAYATAAAVNQQAWNQTNWGSKFRLKLGNIYTQLTLILPTTGPTYNALELTVGNAVQTNINAARDEFDGVFADSAGYNGIVGAKVSRFTGVDKIQKHLADAVVYAKPYCAFWNIDPNLFTRYCLDIFVGGRLVDAFNEQVVSAYAEVFGEPPGNLLKIRPSQLYVKGHPNRSNVRRSSRRIR